jgi:hypothetical protein
MLRADDIDERFGAHWDGLPAGRAAQADVYDSWAWHAGWLRADTGVARSLRVPAVLDGDRPVALLPLTLTRSRAWCSAGLEYKPRSRVVIGTEQPDAAVLGVLAQTLASGGARALALHRLPSRDPATHALLDAMREAGYRIAVRERSTDCLAPVEGGWAGHRRRFKSFAKAAKRFSGRVGRLWDLTMDTYGTSPDALVADGFALYANLQARSWKGPFDQATFVRRAEVLRRAERLGWARIYVLRIAGEPVAGHVWFRIGSVATWMSTAHDQTFKAISPGTIVQWGAQERLFHDPYAAPPNLLDFLPGGNPQKDRLSPDRPPLLEVDAVRRSVVAGVTLRARQEARRVAPAMRARAQVKWRTWREQRAASAGGQPNQVRRTVVTGGDMGWPGFRLDDADPALRRYLAIAAGQSSPEATAEKWADGDSWWLLGDAPVALARVGSDPGRSEPVLREVVRLDPVVTVESAAASLATAMAGPVTLLVADDAGGETGMPVVVRTPPLPWPSSWRSTPPAAALDQEERR